MRVNPVDCAKNFVRLYGANESFKKVDRMVTDLAPGNITNLPRRNPKATEEQIKFTEYLYTSFKKNFIFWSNVRGYLKNHYDIGKQGTNEAR